jgi:hypothetical protein
MSTPFERVTGNAIPTPSELAAREVIPVHDWRAEMPKVKRRQACAADDLAAVASGVGEYGIANACYRLAAILRQHAQGDYSSMTTETPAPSPRGDQA